MTKSDYEKIISQVALFGINGKFGESIMQVAKAYNDLPSGIAIFIKIVSDFHNDNDNVDAEAEFYELKKMFYQSILVAYRECKKKNGDIALSIQNSLFEDYPNVPNSALLLRLSSLIQASLGFREVADTNNKLLIWQQSLKLFQAYNEFLSGLLSFLIIACRCSQKKEIDTGVFSLSYRSKLNQFEQLTGGENGIFYLIFRLAKPSIRNAIAHEAIWLDPNTDQIKYYDGKKKKHEYQINLVDFLSLVSVGSHLCDAYIASIGTMVIWEVGTEKLKSLLPGYLIKILSS